MLGLTPEERLALQRSPRKERYVFELVDRWGIRKKDLAVLSASISVNMDDAVKRRGTFSLLLDEDVDWLSDRIRPVMCVQLQDGTWAQWPKGRYLMMSPKRTLDGKDEVCEVECYGESMILQQDRFVESQTFPAGTPYFDVLTQILISAGLREARVEPSDGVLPAALVLDDSKNKLEWINELCTQINYRDLYMDDEGTPILRPYMLSQMTTPDYSYVQDEISILYPEITIEADFWNVPNVIKRTMSRPDMDPLAAVHINDNPASKLSTIARGGMRIVDTGTIDMVDGQESLQKIVERIAFERQQVSQIVEVETLNMPHHEIYDVIELRTDALNGVFRETGWTMELNTAGKMTHSLQRVVV